MDIPEAFNEGGKEHCNSSSLVGLAGLSSNLFLNINSSLLDAQRCQTVVYRVI